MFLIILQKSFQKEKLLLLVEYLLMMNRPRNIPVLLVGFGLCRAVSLYLVISANFSTDGNCFMFNRIFKSAFVLFPAFALVSVVISASAQNLVANSGFETGDFTGWTVTGSTVHTFVTGPNLYGSGRGPTPYSGNYQAVFGNFASEGDTPYHKHSVPILAFSTTFSSGFNPSP